MEDYADYVKPLLAFTDAHADSGWSSGVWLNIGLGYYHAGYFSRAIPAFEKSWALGRDAKTMQARLMVDPPWPNLPACTLASATKRNLPPS